LVGTLFNLTDMPRYTRRQFLEIAAAGAGAVTAACSLDTAAPRVFTHADMLIKNRPVAPTIAPTVGYSALGLTTPRDGLIYVPTTYQAATAAPLLLLLHPNGQSAQFWEDYGIGALLDDLGVVVLAPDSRAVSWDIIFAGGYRLDPAFFDFAMGYLYKRCNINPARIAIAGFSDGGMEAMGVGVGNGDLFSHVMAYSPGALAAPFSQGKPKVFISHGQADPVLAFEFTRDQIAAKLTAATYDVTFVPFNGNHVIPTNILRQSVEWFLA
jgi:predicted esterase